MAKTAIHKARQHLSIIAGTAEIELADKPLTRDKILKAVRAVDRLLEHIELLSATCPAKDDCPTKKPH